MTGTPDAERGLQLRSVVEAHARIASRAQLLDERRALYRLALTIFEAVPDIALSDDLLDDPVLRYDVGEVLAGRAAPTDLRVGKPRHSVGFVGPTPRIVSTSAVRSFLAPALSSVSNEAGAPIELIIDSDPRFGVASNALRAGLRHARSVVPDLFADLIGHVALVAILDPERTGAVVSASSRTMPGLILLRPGPPLEVAESIIHEAAHQRLFDLAITRDMLTSHSDDCPGFRPSWRSSIWPVEQTLAAFHAYACLTELGNAALTGPRPTSVSRSVLQFAAERTEEIGRWLLDRPDHIGSDAYRLLCAIFGLEVTVEAPTLSLSAQQTYRVGQHAVMSISDGRCLVGVQADELRLFWLDSDAATVLDIMQPDQDVPASAIMQEFERRLGCSGQTLSRVTGALTTLVLSDLVAVT